MSPRLLLLAALLVGCSDAPDNQDMSVGNVIPCTSAAQCPKSQPMCDESSHICVGCTDSFQTCGDGLTCDPTTNTCVPADPNAPCRRNADCPRLGFDSPEKISCEVDSGICYECTSNIDCVEPDVCYLSSHQCLTPDGGT